MGAEVIAAAVLGMYFPIVVFSLSAAVLFVHRLLLPAWQHRTLTLDRYALGLSAFFSLAAHAVENVFYGLIRWFPVEFGWMDKWWAVVGTWKLMILVSACFALVALSEHAALTMWRLIFLGSAMTAAGVASAHLLGVL